LDLLYALAYPKREKDHPAGGAPRKKSSGMSANSTSRSGGAVASGLGHGVGPVLQPPLAAAPLQPTPVPVAEHLAVAAADSEDEESKVEVEEPKPEDADAVQQENLEPFAGEMEMDIPDDDVSPESVVMDEVDGEDEDIIVGDGDTLMLAPTGITEISGGR